MNRVSTLGCGSHELELIPDHLSSGVIKTWEIPVKLLLVGFQACQGAEECGGYIPLNPYFFMVNPMKSPYFWVNDMS